jgi:hypothetical protein
MRRAVEVPIVAIIDCKTNSCIIVATFWQNEAKILNLFKEPRVTRASIDHNKPATSHAYRAAFCGRVLLDLAAQLGVAHADPAGDSLSRYAAGPATIVGTKAQVYLAKGLVITSAHVVGRVARTKRTSVSPAWTCPRVRSGNDTALH